jgi:glycosyltransferase involved in cell wall biosynthesis
MTPLVSILLPCYNAEKYLKYALESILNQEYGNLQILCINDGSTDTTLSILESYQVNDPRIQIINQEINIGLIDSLNNSFSAIKGDYFARMDADDYCPPNRISKQISFLIDNSQFDLVSSGYNYFFSNGLKNKYCAPIGTSPKALQFVSLFSTPLTHASVMGKTSLIKSGKYRYDKNFPYAEDFELFSRLAWQGASLSNMNESLYWVRLNNESVSAVHNASQIETNIKIIRRNLNEYLNIQHKNEEPILKIMLNRMDYNVTIREIRLAFNLFKTYFDKMELSLKFNKEEEREIKEYLKLQKLNIILQSNKTRFSKIGFRNLPFFIESLTLLKLDYLTLLFKKIIK